jgi:KaiC/GvpD/RAD55 family RecA-like ATPase
MKIELKENKKLDLAIPQFNCDHNPLGEHLNQYEMLSHLNSFSFTTVLGRPASGKTSLVISFLTGKADKKVFRKVFNHVILVMPSSSRNSIKKNPFKNHPPEKMYEELDYNTISTIYEGLLESSEKNEKTLLLLDDIGASIKNKEIQKILRKIIYNRRHLKVHIICMLQSYISLPKEVRKLITNAFLFKPSKVEMENFCEELFETKKDKAIEIMNYVYDKPHQYLMLNVENQKMYKGFDELIIHDEEKEDLEKI